MLCEVLNLASQRLPIRHTASHTAPDTRYTLHSRPDRPRTLLQEKRRTNHTVHLPDRVVRSNTARTSSLHIPILHFQSADHRNRSDHTHNLKKYWPQEPLSRYLQLSSIPRNPLQKIESRSYSGWYSSDSSNRSSKTRVQVGNSTVRNVSELNPSKPTTVSNLYSVLCSGSRNVSTSLAWICASQYISSSSRRSSS